MPLRGRLMRLLLALAALLVATAGTLGLTVAHLRSAQDRAQHQLLPAVADAQRLLDAFVNQETGERGLVITGDPAFLQPYTQASALLPAVVTDLQRHATGLPGIADPLAQVLAAHQRWVDDTALPEITAAQRDLPAARALVATGNGRRQFDALRASTGQLQQALAGALSRTNQQVQALSSHLTWLLAGTLGLLTLAITSLYPALQHLVVRPLNRFALDARHAGRDLTTPVRATGPREIVSAARHVEGMRRQLVEQIATARQATEALAQRGPAVLALRAALAPTPTQHPALELASRLQPAEGLLAGDWFDTLDLDRNRLGLVLGDVAGHGPGPAVFALRLKHLLASALALGQDPGQALTFAARQLGDTDEAFATVFVAVLDPTNNSLSYANAGHPAAVLLQPHPRPNHPGLQHVQQHVRQHLPQPRTAGGTGHHPLAPPSRNYLELGATGPLLTNLVATWSWGTQHEDYMPGDLLLAYTDGITEARNNTGEQYGTDRLLHQISHNPQRPADTLIHDRLRDVNKHSGGQATDDTSLLACRHLPG